MDTQRRHVSLEDLVGSWIVGANHERIGRVVDVQVSPGPTCRVTGLMYGRSSWLYRLHVLEPLVRRFGMHVAVHVIPWQAVERFERFTVKLKPGWEGEARHIDVTPEADPGGGEDAPAHISGSREPGLE
jgi:hypothetical protein